MKFRAVLIAAGVSAALVAFAVAPSAHLAAPSFAQNATPVVSPADATPVGATPVAALPPVALPTLADLGIALPAGVEVVPLAAAPIDNVGAATLLRLERVSVPAGGELPPRTPTGPELLFGELGSVAVVDAFGLTAPLGPGQQASIVAGSPYTLSNPGTAPASLLRLVLGDPATPPDAAAQPLVEAALPAPPTAPATLLLARAAWQPGADTGSFTAAGPIGLAVTAGTLTVTSPSGLEAPLTPPQGLVFPAGVPQRERNAGAEPAQALLIAVVPQGQPLVAAVPTPTQVPTATPAPTSTPIPTPTPQPTATPLPTSTPEPTPTPTPLPEAGSVLFEVDSPAAFEAWTGGQLLDGMLVTDGMSIERFMAPIELGAITDYAVEAEVQVIRVMDWERQGPGRYECADSTSKFGFFVRDEGYESFVCYNEWHGSPYVRIRAVPYDTFEPGPYDFFDPGSDWHTYRVEIVGNSMRFLVDGQEILEVTDNQFLSESGGTVGFIADYVQVNVRVFRVIAL